MYIVQSKAKKKLVNTCNLGFTKNISSLSEKSQQKNNVGLKKKEIVNQGISKSHYEIVGY